MNQRTLQLNLPNTIEQSDEELRLLIAAKLYENKNIDIRTSRRVGRFKQKRLH